MKKSMFALFGCALVAGSVMAAEVTGNNTAVVIQNTPVVSSNLYQFLIVPVKGFDITGNGTNAALSLDEILPPALYDDGTIVYQNGTTKIAEVKNDQWVWRNTDTPFEETYAANTILWMQSPVETVIDDIPSTVFCGELVNDTVAVTPVPGQFVAFGNATSLAVTFGQPSSTEVTLKAIKVNNVGDLQGAQPGDMIYRLKSESGDYEIVRYNGTNWMKAPESGITPVNADNDLLPAGAAAYYYRKATN